MKKLIRLALIFTLGLILVGSGTVIARSQSLDPAQLNQHGFEQLNHGNPARALKLWQDAEAGYHTQQNKDGVLGSQTNQSLALQALGLFPRACTTLINALAFPQELCQARRSSLDVSQLVAHVQTLPRTDAVVSALISLGDVLRGLGRTDAAQVVLEQTRDRVRQSNPDTSAVLLSLANVERSIYQQQRDRVGRTAQAEARLRLLSEIQKTALQALNSYQQVEQLAPQIDRLGLFAQLNRLGLLIELKQSSSQELRSPALDPMIATEIPKLVQQLTNASFTALPPIQAIYAHLNLAQSLRALGQTERAIAHSDEALKLAQTLQNVRAQSAALGLRAMLNRDQGQTSIALSRFEQATALAQSIKAQDIEYRWQRSLGQLYRDRGLTEQAEQAYAAATATLNQVQTDSWTGAPALQFSLQDEVEPIYREYLQILLKNPQPKDLRQAIRINQRLQQVELENFLRCGRIDLIALDQIAPPSQGQATVFHILDLGDRVGVVVQDQANQLHYYTAAAETVKDQAQNLTDNLQNDFLGLDEAVFLPFAQSLYRSLIAPAQQNGYLPSSGTIAFAVDPMLQGIPMNLLHDGQDYLVQHYSTASVGIQLRQPKKLPPGKLHALIAGLSEASPSFNDPKVPKHLKPLPDVGIEIQNLQSKTDSTVLLNRAFTVRSFQQQLGQNDFPIVHLTTHGQFSSNPSETFLLAWDRPIDIDQIYQTVRRRTDQDQSIELLVLSACQTAIGDRRSPIGIAGIAAQAGARATVASLWQVDAASTATLMTEFYTALSKGQTKAEALKAAQLALLKNPKTAHPYYWSGFILVGSWL